MVSTFRMPKTTRRMVAPTGPKPARAIGNASTPAPTVSVSVRVKASQNGGSDSSRCEMAARRHRKRSRTDSGASPAAATSAPVRCRYASSTTGSSAPSAARRLRAWTGRPYFSTIRRRISARSAGSAGTRLAQWSAWRSRSWMVGRSGRLRPSARALRNWPSDSAAVRSVSKRAIARRARDARSAVRASIAYRSVLARRAGMPPVTSARVKIGASSAVIADQRGGDRAKQNGHGMVRFADREDALAGEAHDIVRMRDDRGDRAAVGLLDPRGHRDGDRTYPAAC